MILETSLDRGLRRLFDLHSQLFADISACLEYRLRVAELLLLFAFFASRSENGADVLVGGLPGRLEVLFLASLPVELVDGRELLVQEFAFAKDLMKELKATPELRPDKQRRAGPSLKRKSVLGGFEPGLAADGEHQGLARSNFRKAHKEKGSSRVLHPNQILLRASPLLEIERDFLSRHQFDLRSRSARQISNE